MSPIFEKWLHESVQTSEREERIFIEEVYALDAALISEVRQDEPNKAIPAKAKIMIELLNRIPQGVIDEMIEEKLPADGDYNDAVIIGQSIIEDITNTLIELKRPDALKQIRDQQIPVRVRDDDTGEIQVIPPSAYVAQVIHEENITLPTGTTDSEQNLTPGPIANPELGSYGSVTVSEALETPLEHEIYRSHTIGAQAVYAAKVGIAA